MIHPARFPSPLPLQWLRQRVLRRLRRDDGGFILLESIIAISLITVIMSAVGAEYVSGLANSNHQRYESAAIQLADTAMEQIRALHPSDLLSGRTQVAVIAERNALTAIPAVSSWVSADPKKVAYSDAGGTANVPTTPNTQVQPFSIYKYLECFGDNSLASPAGSCSSTADASGTVTANYARAIVAVTWNQRGCANNSCAYVMSSLVSTDGDPQFDDNQPLPPAPKIATSTATQVVEVGDSINVALKVQDGTGVPMFLWSEPATEPPGDVTLSTLGLSLSPAGNITGYISPSAVSGSKTQVVVSDGLGARTDTMDITWTVYPQLTFPAPSDQTNSTNQAVNVTVAASGGKAAYTYSDADSTLPPGLSISPDGKITGTPSTAGSYNVHLGVSDSLSHLATSNTFVWTVFALGSLNDAVSVTEGQNVDQTLSYTCPTNLSCTLSLSGTIPGLGLVPSTPVTGSGTAHITGQVQSSAVTSGTSATYRPVVTISSSGRGSVRTAAVTWTAYTAPTVSASATTTSQNSYPSMPVAYTCPNSPCTIALTNPVPGVGLSASVATGSSSSNVTISVATSTGTVYLAGQASAGTATGSLYSPTLTITDFGGVTGTDTDAWKSYTAPTVGFPGVRSVSKGSTVTQSMSVTCATNSCSVSTVGLPTGVGINTTGSTSTSSTTSISLRRGTTTVYLSGTVSSSAASGSYVISVTATESGRSITSVGVWTVS